MTSIDPRQGARPAWRTLGPELLLLAGAGVFALLGQGRWARLTEDHGFWFSAAQGLLRGGRAMHEVRVQYGPGSLWVVEALCRLFGPSASTLVISQFAIGLAGVLGIHAISRRFLSPIERWLSAFLLVVLIVWMGGPGNLLYPCAFAISHALLLFALTLFAHDSLLRRFSAKWSWLSGALAGLVFLTKQEFGVSAAAGVAALTLLMPGLSRRAKAAALALAAAGFAVAYFGVLEIARQGEPFGQFVSSNLLWPWVGVPEPWRQLFHRSLGLEEPMACLRDAFDSFLSLAVIGGTAWAFLYLRSFRARERAFAVALAAGWTLWLWRWSEGSHFTPMTLTLPAILASSLLFLVAVGSGSRARPEGKGVFAALALAALVLLQREGYRGGIEGYYSGMGYVLAVPVVAPLVGALIRGPRDAGRRRVAAFLLLFGALGYFGLGRLNTLEREWNDSVAFHTTRGTLYAGKGSAAGVEAEARFLEKHSSPKDPVLILPSADGLDFLLDRRNLSSFPYVSPGFLTPEGERELIDRCRRFPPRAVVVVRHTFGFLRAGDFGNGFANDLTAWLGTNYHEDREFELLGGPSREWLLPNSTVNPMAESR